MTESPLIQELVAEGRHRDILEFLVARFDAVPLAVEEKIRRIQDASRMDALVRAAAHCSSIEGFRAQLD